MDRQKLYRILVVEDELIILNHILSKFRDLPFRWRLSHLLRMGQMLWKS